MKAMQEFIGIRKQPSQPFDAMEYVRSLRRSDRLDLINDDRSRPDMSHSTND
jgi:hypothetical protein